MSDKGWNILFQVDLPSDMCNEILDRCTPSALARLALINKEWAHRVRDRLECHLTRDLHVHFYLYDSDTRYMNWCGPLTYGSASERGQWVHVYEHTGFSVREDFTVYRYDGADGDALLRYKNDSDVFCDDRILLHVDSLIKVFPVPWDIQLVSIDNLAEFQTLCNNRTDNYHWGVDPALFGDILEALLDKWEHGALLHSSTFLTYKSWSLFLKSPTEFFSEIRRVHAIGERNDVTFGWV